MEHLLKAKDPFVSMDADNAKRVFTVRVVQSDEAHSGFTA
jgi:hypothetical protein